MTLGEINRAREGRVRIKPSEQKSRLHSIEGDNEFWARWYSPFADEINNNPLIEKRKDKQNVINFIIEDLQRQIKQESESGNIVDRNLAQVIEKLKSPSINTTKILQKFLVYYINEKIKQYDELPKLKDSLNLKLSPEKEKVKLEAEFEAKLKYRKKLEKEAERAEILRQNIVEIDENTQRPKGEKQDTKKILREQFKPISRWVAAGMAIAALFNSFKKQEAPEIPEPERQKNIQSQPDLADSQDLQTANERTKELEQAVREMNKIATKEIPSTVPKNIKTETKPTKLSIPTDNVEDEGEDIIIDEDADNGILSPDLTKKLTKANQDGLSVGGKKIPLAEKKPSTQPKEHKSAPKDLLPGSESKIETGTSETDFHFTQPRPKVFTHEETPTTKPEPSRSLKKGLGEEIAKANQTSLENIIGESQTIPQPEENITTAETPMPEITNTPPIDKIEKSTSGDITLDMNLVDFLFSKSEVKTTSGKVLADPNKEKKDKILDQLSHGDKIKLFDLRVQQIEQGETPINSLLSPDRLKKTGFSSETTVKNLIETAKTAAQNAKVPLNEEQFKNFEDMANLLFDIKNNASKETKKVLNLDDAGQLGMGIGQTKEAWDAVTAKIFQSSSTDVVQK